ncbi:MAG: hypothetical protein GWP50_00130 [Proteobacteria bacterium]|nr:hypothetical protein [Pseudomonadota bacterium]
MQHHVPTVNLADFLASGLSGIDQQALARACEDHGFFLLEGHGKEALVAQVFAQAQGFFAQPKAMKHSVYRNEENPLGYYDRELTKQRRDLKEVFDFKTGGHISKNPLRHSRWPEKPAQLRPTLTEFFSAFTGMSEQVMTMMLMALGLPESDARNTVEGNFGASHTSAARLNYYPAEDPVSAQERQELTPLGDMALHHHTDPGAITLLLQDDHGGLQAESKRHGWIDVPPKANAIVVNIGDVMQVWSNDRCTAGCHRVLPVRSTTGRYSVPFFFQPKVDAMIEPWLSPGERAHYQSFSWQQYIRGRVTDNFADYGVEDIQIERYRVA